MTSSYQSPNKNLEPTSGNVFVRVGDYVEYMEDITALVAVEKATQVACDFEIVTNPALYNLRKLDPSSDVITSLLHMLASEFILTREFAYQHASVFKENTENGAGRFRSFDSPFTSNVQHQPATLQAIALPARQELPQNYISYHTNRHPQGTAPSLSVPTHPLGVSMQDPRQHSANAPHQFLLTQGTGSRQNPTFPGRPLGITPPATAPPRTSVQQLRNEIVPASSPVAPPQRRPPWKPPIQSTSRSSPFNFVSHGSAQYPAQVVPAIKHNIQSPPPTVAIHGQGVPAEVMNHNHASVTPQVVTDQVEHVPVPDVHAADTGHEHGYGHPAPESSHDTDFEMSNAGQGDWDPNTTDLGMSNPWQTHASDESPGN